MQINDKIVSSGLNSITNIQELKLFQRDHNKAIDNAKALPFGYSLNMNYESTFSRDNEEMDVFIENKRISINPSFKSLVAIILK